MAIILKNLLTVTAPKTGSKEDHLFLIDLFENRSGRRSAKVNLDLTAHARDNFRQHSE